MHKTTVFFILLTLATGLFEPTKAAVGGTIVEVGDTKVSAMMVCLESYALYWHVR